MTIDEVKEHFRGAKTVICLADLGQTEYPYNEDKVKMLDFNIWCEDCLIYDFELDELAKIKSEL